MSTTTTRKSTSTRTTKPRAPRTTTPKTETVESVPEVTYEIPESPEERQGLIDAYKSLQAAGLPIPDSIKVPVESLIEETLAAQAAQEKLEAERTAEEQAREQARVEKLNQTGPPYVRNRTGLMFAFNLERLQESEHGKNKITLNPRGTRGDIQPLKKGDEDDPNIVQNRNLNLIEILPAGIARQILANQQYNANTAYSTPSPLNIVQDEYRTAKQNGVNVEAIPQQVEFTQNNDITVGTVTPTENNRSLVSGNVQPVAPGTDPMVTQLPVSNDHNTDALIAMDNQAKRSPNLVEDLRNSLSVSVDPVQRN